MLSPLLRKCGPFMIFEVYLDSKFTQGLIAHSVIKGIVQPFELGGVTSLIPSAVRFCKAGHFQKIF